MNNKIDKWIVKRKDEGLVNLPLITVTTCDARTVLWKTQRPKAFAQQRVTNYCCLSFVIAHVLIKAEQIPTDPKDLLYIMEAHGHFLNSHFRSGKEGWKIVLLSLSQWYNFPKEHNLFWSLDLYKGERQIEGKKTKHRASTSKY